MPATGDTAILRYGSDNKWHYDFLPARTSTILGFGSLSETEVVVMGIFATAAQGTKADTALQNAAAFDSAGAASAAQAFAIQRANQTGTQPVNTITGLGTQLSVDTGWTANNTAGDKTAALSSYTNGLNSTIITALNLAAANSGTVLGAALDVLVIVVKKLAALETVLVASKLPNA